jgi:hypothetical protein
MLPSGESTAKNDVVAILVDLAVAAQWDTMRADARVQRCLATMRAR